jgi:hypothetical protein
LVFFVIQVVGLASTVLQLMGLTCLLADSLKKPTKNKHKSTTIDLFLFFILQVVGLASTLLQLVGLTCLLADSLKKT